MGKITWTLIFLNVLVFEIIFSMPEALLRHAFDMLAFSTPHLPELWRLVTSLFVHASATHLFFNMIGLYFFGKIAEKELGSKKFLALYFAAGIAGSLAFGFVSPEPAVGASGCIFGLMGFAMFVKPKELISMYVVPLPLGIVAILFAAVETLLAYHGETASGVAHVAHVAGLAVGILFAVAAKPRKFGRGLLWLGAFVLLIVAIGPLFGLIIDIGNVFLDAVDFVAGFVLYGIAKLIGAFVW
jgi:hypothetical protein